MNIVNLQIRIARKLALGRGSLQLTQSDLDILVQSGSYAALCNAATEELKEHRSQPPVANTAVRANLISLKGFAVPEEVAPSAARYRTLNASTRSRLTPPISPALIKIGAPFSGTVGN